jgi:hypothetical protein
MRLDGSRRAFERCAPPRGGWQAEDPSNGASFHPSKIMLDQTAREACPIAA